MIVKFINRALSALDAIYGIVGGTSRTDRIDLSPVILVHDVSREAERAASIRVRMSIAQATGGAGVTVTTTVTRKQFLTTVPVSNNLQQLGLEPDEVDVWVLGYWAFMTAGSTGNLAAVLMALQLGFDTASADLMTLKAFNAEGLSNGLGVIPLAATSQLGVFADNPDTLGHHGYPILLPDNPNSSFLATFTDDAGGAITATTLWDVWIGAKGTFPLGG